MYVSISLNLLSIAFLMCAESLSIAGNMLRCYVSDSEHWTSALQCTTARSRVKNAHALKANSRQAVLSRARRAADLVLSYGRQAAIALLTWGVGPQTAASILAKMHVRDEDFYADLLKAKLRYIQTRPFWD
jgi:hypothetical protein